MQHRTPDPAVITVFGITGDLAKRKLLPALYHLFHQDLLAPNTKIIGISRKQQSVDELLSHVELCILETDNVCDPVSLKKFRDSLSMLQLEPENNADFIRLSKVLDDFDVTAGRKLNRLFYLSIPPETYLTVVRNLGSSTAVTRSTDREVRLLVEKPFGWDENSAQQLVDATHEHFEEHEIFRIDHYLAKGTAQNILTFRASNPLFKDVWNSEHIEQIEVIASETRDVAGRGSFYDPVGALRDLVQSHLLQLLALTTLEIPDTIDEQALARAKAAVLDQVVVERPDMAIRLQYEGYLADIEKESSNTETFTAIPMTIDNPQWKDTKVLLATGKNLAEKFSHIRVRFRPEGEAPGNILTFRLEPNEGIDITLQVRKPGYEHALQPALLDYDYSIAKHPDAYERVLIDALKGQHLLFASSEEVMASWRILQPVISKWRDTDEVIGTYVRGTRIEELYI